MAEKTLAVKYRPKTFDDVVEQGNIKVILSQQLKNNAVKNAYLFVGGAGTGKTTCARIFANEINAGKGNPIEMDAASHSSVDDVREVIQQAKTKAIDAEYKVFIIDECHSISNTGWQAFLKLLEEPPAKSIFIFCTTNPEKIPKTILSRVQRYDFQRISQKGIVDRLRTILYMEKCLLCGGDPAEVGDPPDYDYSDEALEYIAKIADGGMRDAISLMDKCLAFSTELTLKNVIETLGTVDYDTMFRLTNRLMDGKTAEMVDIIEELHNAGKDLKQFVKSYSYFLVDILKFSAGCDFTKLQIPALDIYKTELEGYGDWEFKFVHGLLKEIIQLSADIKYSTFVKADIEAKLMLICLGGDEAWQGTQD